MSQVLTQQSLKLVENKTADRYRIEVIDKQTDGSLYQGADKSLARPWKETSYSDQDLRHYTKIYGVPATGIYSCCFLLFVRHKLLQCSPL